MSKLIFLLTAVTALSLSVNISAQAACPATAKTVFSCSTTKGKQVDICDLGSQLSYSFGKPRAKPELQFNLAQNRASLYLWDGMTSSEYNELYLPRGNTVYQAYHANHRNHGGTEHGIKVFVNKNEVADVRCRSTSVIENLQDIKLPRITGDERL